MLYGRGAGKLPTASAVVADVMDLARGVQVPRPLAWQAGGDDVVAPVSELRSDWCVRLAGEVPEEWQPVYWPEAPEGQYALLLADMTRGEMDEALEGLCVLSAYRMLG